MLNADGMAIGDKALFLKGQFGVVQFFRDRHVGQEFAVTVRLADVRGKYAVPTGDIAAFYVGVALRAIGYRMRD